MKYLSVCKCPCVNLYLLRRALNVVTFDGKTVA